MPLFSPAAERLRTIARIVRAATWAGVDCSDLIDALGTPDEYEVLECVRARVAAARDRAGRHPALDPAMDAR